MPPKFPRVNHQITAPEVSLSDYEGKYLGRLPTAEARRLTREGRFALIEKYPDHQPPSCALVPQWMVERVKHYFRGPAESLRSDLPPMGLAYLEFDEDGWNTRLVYVFGGRYYSSRGLRPMEHHPILDQAVLSDQPRWVGKFDEPDVALITAAEFEAAWRQAESA